MLQSQVAPLYDHFLTYLVEKATPQEILAFEIPEADQARVLDLLDKQDADTLTDAEAAELEQMQSIDRLISVLKAKALVASGRA